MDEHHRFRVLKYLEYLAVRGVFAAFSLCPERAGRPLGRFFGRGMGRWIGSRSRRAADNLVRAFPAAPAERIAFWVRRMWENLGEALWEVAHISRLSKDEFERFVDFQGREIYDSAVAGGKGVIVFTAHFGNWEAASPEMSVQWKPVAFIGRRIKNPYLNDYIARVRGRFGGRALLHKNAVRESLKWLKAGNVMGILFDQRITDGGLAIPFFGRPAMTTGLPALLALRLGSPVHPLKCWRDGDGLHIRMEPAVDLEGLKADKEGIHEAMTRMTAVIEKWIRERPDQWLWMHDRWKM